MPSRGRSAAASGAGIRPRHRCRSLGHRAVDVLGAVRSARALDYVREFDAALGPWQREPAVRDFLRRSRSELGVAA
ncbi:hypothetical protein [Kitasatospora sp. NPDC048407]|uniref:hypothetical protein n=1 Tax=Kitasatospora sp. NPDC048407 TaxID=3364051 RepID=UPI003714D15A